MNGIILSLTTFSSETDVFDAFKKLEKGLKASSSFPTLIRLKPASFYPKHLFES